MKIITVGAAVQDVFLSNVPSLTPVCINPETCFEMLELGSKADVNNIFFSTGGGATNAATTFARQGFDVQFMGMIGRDPAGEAVLQDLDKENINTELLKYSDTHNTGFSVLLLASTGERTILTYRGASTHYHNSDLDLQGVNADWLYVTTLSGSMDILDKLFRQAKEANMKIMFNPGKKELAQAHKMRGLLPDVDILLANKQELSQIFEGEDLEELVRHALNVVPVVLGTDGGNGACVSDGKIILRSGVCKGRVVVDQTGAGDAFGSGFLSRWIRSGDLLESVIFANTNAASVVGHMGAKTGIVYQDHPLGKVEIIAKDFATGEEL